MVDKRTLRADLGTLIVREGMLDLTTYRLQSWFAYHLADSPVTQLAYGIPESCGRLSKIAQFNPKLLRYDEGGDDHEQFYFEQPHAVAIKHTPEELASMREAISREKERVYNVVGKRYLADHPGEDEDGQIAARARDLAASASVRAKDMLELDIDKYDTGELVDLGGALPVEADSRLRRLQATHKHAVRTHPRLVYVFGDPHETLAAQRYVEGKHDRDDDEGTMYRIIVLQKDRAHLQGLRDRKKFRELVTGNRQANKTRKVKIPDPVVVDLYKPLPKWYARTESDKKLRYGAAPRLARMLFELQRDYWIAMNANPRYVYRQELRTYMFDPNMASPERLVEDCFYWSSVQNESVRQARAEMYESAERFASLGDAAEQKGWSDIFAYDTVFVEKAKGEWPPNQVPDELDDPTRMRYETKLRLEASNWESKDDDQRTDKNIDPERPDFYVEFCEASALKACPEPYRAWTHFQVGQWYRDAEFRRTMYRIQEDLPVGPDEATGWDYARYTTVERGQAEADEALFEYERRLNVEERELEPEPHDTAKEELMKWIGELEDPSGQMHRLSSNLHRRCPVRDVINWDVSFDQRVVEAGERETEKEQAVDASDSDSEAGSDASGEDDVEMWLRKEQELERLYGAAERDASARAKSPPPPPPRPPKRRRSGSQTYLEQTKQRRADRDERMASQRKRRATNEEDEDDVAYKRALAAYEEESVPAMRRLEQLKKAQRVSSVVDEAFFRAMRTRR